MYLPLTILLQADHQDPNDLHENKLVAIIIVFVIFGFAIWKAWPALMANNVFSKQNKYDYGRSEELLDRKKSYAHQLVTGVFLLGLAGLVLMIWDYLQQTDYNQPVGHKFQPMGFFAFSLIGAISTLIYTVLDEAVFTTHNLKYALKVWLTTHLVAPAALILMDWHRIINFKWFLYLYHNTVLLGYGVSIFSFLVFVLAAHYITIKHVHIMARRLYILLTVEVCVLVNMFIVSLILRSGIGWLLEVLPYCIIAGLCIRFYPMDKTVYSEGEFYDAEEIEE